VTEPDLAEFARAFARLSTEAYKLVGAGRPSLLTPLREHLGDDLATMPVVGERFASYDHVNVQVGLDAVLGAAGRRAELVGIAGQFGRHNGLSELIAQMGQGEAIPPGPVDYVNLPDGPDSRRACVNAGLYLLDDGGRREAVFVRGPSEHNEPVVLVEVAGADPAAGQRLLDELRVAMAAGNVFRGRVLALRGTRYGPAGAEFVTLDPVDADGLVLPPGVLDRIERQTSGFSSRREALAAAGRHLKRGLLLHGPPGTGKTLTVRHIAGSLPGHTVLLLAGQGLHYIGPALELARELQPAVVVLEDVDLIAEERTGVGPHGFLFELLEGMDGLDGDADVVFVLTTNRPDLLEPALATRPGRIDLAVEVPLPDAPARARLISLYARGLRLDVPSLDPVVERTEGVTASFITELLRKAALLAALEAEPIVVTARHLDAALDELTDAGSALTRSLLGGGGTAPVPVGPGPEPGLAPPGAPGMRPHRGMPSAYGSDFGWYAYGPES
jgi:ATPase family associated with various cellular activities (AAA)